MGRPQQRARAGAEPRVASSAACWVVLVPGRGLWSTVDHGIEVCWRLVAAVPDASITWAASDEDAWFVEHDLRHAGLLGRVGVAPTDSVAVRGATVVVETSYENRQQGLVERARAAGVPVVGFAVDDSDAARSHRVAALDVEALVLLIASICATHPQVGPNRRDLTEDTEETSGRP